MVTVYRGTLAEPIVFPESVIITDENLDSIDFEKVIYCEVSPMGAMGNEGGILIYVLSDEDNLVTYETNVSIDQQSCDAVSERIDKNVNLLVYYNGGLGNYVYIKKNAQLEIDEKYGCFWYHSKNSKLRIDSSVPGVYRFVAGQMGSQDSGNIIKKGHMKQFNLGKTEKDEDVELDEFADEIEPWIIDELKNIGCDSAKDVLAIPVDDLVKRTDLEEETIREVIRILNEEFE